jgi:carboxypeptidase C (cathepsin A)
MSESKSDSTKDDASRVDSDKLDLTEQSSVTQHTLEVGEHTLSYTATAGTLNLQTEEGTDKASIFYTAYTLNGVEDASRRPVTFCFNGGPGAASVWLHLGVLGPRRIDIPDMAVPPPPPYRLVDNPHTILDKTDLVFIDPVGTGFSRPADDETGKDYYSVKGDIESVADFIRRYISRNHRWNSPRFLAGESYGTTRSAALAAHLQDEGIVLNGIVLVSLALDFQSFFFEEGNDLPYVLYLPTYAAIARYHGVIETGGVDRDAFLDEVRRFALDEYAPALLKGSRISAAEEERIAAGLAAYTGLDAGWIRSVHLRIEYMRFAKTVLGRHGYTVGRMDGRYVGPDANIDHHRSQRDPSLEAPLGAFTAVINDYLRRELQFESERLYRVFSYDAHKAWKWDQKDRVGYTNAAAQLRKALISNPHLKVLIANGIYDLATPFFAAEYTANHLEMQVPKPENIEVTHYEAGHMMYFYAPALAELTADIDRFLESALQ